MLSATRHRDAHAPRTGRRRVLGSVSPAQRLLSAVIAAMLLLAGLSNIGGTYAMWTDEATVEGGTITTGTASLTAQWDADDSEPTWSNLLPGESADRRLTLENTGSVPMEVTATLQAAVPGIELVASSTPSMLEPGQELPLTVEIAATEDLHPGDEVHFTVQFDGRQIR